MPGCEDAGALAVPSQPGRLPMAGAAAGRRCWRCPCGCRTWCWCGRSADVLLAHSSLRMSVRALRQRLSASGASALASTVAADLSPMARTSWLVGVDGVRLVAEDGLAGGVLHDVIEDAVEMRVGQHAPGCLGRDHLLQRSMACYRAFIRLAAKAAHPVPSAWELRRTSLPDLLYASASARWPARSPRPALSPGLTLLPGLAALRTLAASAEPSAVWAVLGAICGGRCFAPVFGDHAAAAPAAWRLRRRCGGWQIDSCTHGRRVGTSSPPPTFGQRRHGRRRTARRPPRSSSWRNEICGLFPLAVVVNQWLGAGRSCSYRHCRSPRRPPSWPAAPGPE